tara:strand:- start:1825 stop:3129 length:1305 start_codon:yes stop_codon:yes gene_type:complete
VKSPDSLPYNVDLGKNTVLIGDNEAGKSAIAESIQLARVGSAFGLLYRDKPIKDGSLLSSLIPHGSSSCSVDAELSDGETCFWELEKGKRPKREGPEGAALSVAELHAVMAGNPETKAKFFWEKLCESVPVGDLLSEIPSDLQEALILVLPGMEGSVSLVEVLTRLGKIQRNQSSVVKAGQIALESLGSFKSVSDEEVKGIGKGLSRAHLRDLVQMIYIDYRSDPTLQAKHVLRHLIDYLGGEEAIKRIPPTEEVQGEMSEVLLSKRLSRAASAARNGEVRAKSLQDSLKKLKGEILRVMFDMLDRASDEFIELVSSFLPKPEKLHFDPTSPTFEIGLWRGEGGPVDVALSGSTEARVLAAIASALGDENDLIVVDDRMWDADTLSKTMKVLEKAKPQVILMTTIRPKGKKKANWKYVQISRTVGEPLEITSSS